MASQVPFEIYTHTGREKYPEYANHTCAHMCSIMGEFHNSVYRALNSAYTWSYRLPSLNADARDLLDYTSILLEMIHIHHDWEEQSYFPTLEGLAGEKGMFGDNRQAHTTFEPAMVRFADWCKAKEGYTGEKFRQMMDGFAPAMQSHMDNEPETFFRLKHVDSDKLYVVYKEQETAAMAKASLWKFMPVVMGSMDHSFVIDDLKESPHPIPWFLPYLVHYVFSWPYARLWKFNGSDFWGNVKKEHLS